MLINHGGGIQPQQTSWRAPIHTVRCSTQGQGEEIGA